MCDYATECAFFKKELASMPADTEDLIKNFCNDNSLHCARQMVFSAKGSCPDDILPGDKDKAYGIIAG